MITDIIFNSTPLIALSRINRLDILQRLYHGIIVPEAVYNELVEQGAGKSGAEEIREAKWIRRETVSDGFAVELLLDEMDKGEAEAIVLSAEKKGSLLLIDNKKPYEKAKALGLRVRRTLSVLVEAYKKGFILDFKEVLDGIRRKGFYMDEEIYLKDLCERRWL